MRRTLTGWVVAAAMVAPAAADPLESFAAGAAGAESAIVIEGTGSAISTTSLRRIRQALAAPGPTEASEGRRPLAVDFEVHVVGSRPATSVVDDMDLRTGAPVPYGTPTHDDLRWLWAPWPGGRALAGAPAARTGWRTSW